MSRLHWEPEARRWHCDGKPIHAGTLLEIEDIELVDDGDRARPTGRWTRARIESRNVGRTLDAIVDVGGWWYTRCIAQVPPNGEPIVSISAARWPAPTKPRRRKADAWDDLATLLIDLAERAGSDDRERAYGADLLQELGYLDATGGER